MRFRRILCALIACLSFATAALAQQVDAPAPETGSISGTVTDVNGGIVPGATIVLEGPASEDRRTISASDNGSFQLSSLKPGTPFHVTISANGFANWTSPEVVLKPGQYAFLSGITLQLAEVVTSVTVSPSAEQIATEQVTIEEHQRVFGIIPNYYVAYDRNPAPLTTKLKFSLAFKTSIDPVTFIGVSVLASADQAADRPDYVQGAQGFGQRMGSIYADGLSDILVGGAILPSLLHQDPRYFYQGTSTGKSRARHALLSPFICKGDNGQWQPNYSSIGGDLASAALANTYYPTSNRGPGLLFSIFLINTTERLASDFAQEFLLRRFTPNAKDRN